MHFANRISSSSPRANGPCNSTWPQPATLSPRSNIASRKSIPASPQPAIFPIPRPSRRRRKPRPNPTTNLRKNRPNRDKLVSVSGSGFVVSKNAHIVTNNHVVADCVGDIHGNLVGQAPVKLRVVSADEENDLALLQGTKKFKEKDIATIRASAVNSGDQVVAIGYPLHGLLTSDLTVTTGIISSLAGLHNDTRFLQISAPVQPGNSGGPLHDNSGNIVGVVTAKLDALRVVKATGEIPQNINFAIKTGALRDFLDNSAPISDRRSRKRNEDRRHCQRGADIHDADFVLGT
jgi:S1-C subfamily serine protease